ncbi:MAG: DUF4097 family beta strand repeat-containing protein [Gemmatimonadales bacterium]
MIRPFALTAIVVAAPLAAQQAERFTLSGPEVAIFNLVGSLSIDQGAGTDVVVTVTRSGRDASQLTVERTTLRSVPSLRVVYPGDRIIYPAMGRGSNTRFTLRDDGTWDGTDWGRHGRGSHEIEITGSGSGLEASARLQISIPTGRKVTVHLGVGTVDVANVDGTLEVDVSSASISTRATRGSLTLDTGSGNIEVDDHTGNLRLDSGSGDIRVATQKNGELHIDTGSGSVRTSGITTTTLKIDTGSGEIQLGEITATRVSLETGSGSIEARFLTAIEDLKVETGSGDVTLRLPDGLNATVDLETSSGNLTLDFPVQLIRKEENSLRGRIGDGRGRIQVESGSGDISLLK